MIKKETTEKGESAACNPVLKRLEIRLNIHCGGEGGEGVKGGRGAGRPTRQREGVALESGPAVRPALAFVVSRKNEAELSRRESSRVTLLKERVLNSFQTRGSTVSVCRSGLGFFFSFFFSILSQTVFV